jgi:hypothetical protein
MAGLGDKEQKVRLLYTKYVSIQDCRYSGANQPECSSSSRDPLGVSGN